MANADFDQIPSNTSFGASQSVRRNSANSAFELFTATADGLLPSQSGNSGKFLSTNGSVVSWASIATGITIGTTPISSGTNNRVLFQSGGVVSQDADLQFDGTNFGVGIAPTTRFQVDLNNADYTNTAGANSHILLTNPSGSGQNVIGSMINGAWVAKWRTDFASNINWCVFGSGEHNFYTGGDYGDGGTPKLKITSGGNIAIGLGFSGPSNRLCVNGGVAVGSYAGSVTAPTNSLIVSGKIGAGNSAPSENLHLTGNFKIDDGGNIICGTSTGTKIGTGSTQKIGFYGVTPVTQRTLFGGITDATGGTSGTTINIDDGMGGIDVAALNDALATIINRLNAARNILLDVGIAA